MADASQIAAGIDARRFDAERDETLDRAIDRIAFGDAAEIDPERPRGADAPIVEHFDVAPVGAARRRWRIGRPRQEIPRHEFGRDGRIEPALRRACERERERDDLARARIDRHRLARRVTVDARHIARGIVKTHEPMHRRDFVERRLDRGERARRVDAVDADVDERSEQRARAARAHRQAVFNACA